MELIYEIVLSAVLIIGLIIVTKEMKECRIRGIYAITSFDFLFMLINPSKYFKKEYLVEGWITKFIQTLIIIGLVYLFIQIFNR